MPKRTRPFPALAKAWLADASGGALTEFVIITPIAIAFIGLLIFAGQGLEAIGKVNLTARTVASLVTQQTGTISSANLACIINLASQVMTPFDPTTLTITVSEIQIDGTGVNGVVQWSSNTQVRPTGSTVPVTTGAFQLHSYQIYAEVAYSFYPPTLSSIGMLSSALTLHRSIFMEPRNGLAINRGS